ncbi:HNH endonuclease [Bradyrhizobium sp. Pha-3]|uniref:HNH endonuclease n=1 Tax=Bradyrhizobium sp. Pha-3 TaxID=208375 RepID=UPI0035D4D4CB
MPDFPSRQQRLHILLRDALIQQQRRCAYCKVPLSRSTATADHKHPRCRDGRTSRGNIVAACLSCNRAKGDMHEGAFYRMINRARPIPGTPANILLIWAARRIWRRTHQACAAIERRVRAPDVPTTHTSSLRPDSLYGQETSPT